MSNQLANEILSDGFRNASVRITGILDTSDVALAPGVSLSDFTNNDVRMGTFWGLRVDRITYSIGDGLQVQLLWESVSPKLIAGIAGRGNLNHAIDGGLIPLPDVGYTGNILISTTGFGVQGPSPQNFFISLSMIKLYR